MDATQVRHLHLHLNRHRLCAAVQQNAAVPGVDPNIQTHLHDRVQVQLAGTVDGVLAALLHLGDQQGVRLVDLTQTLHLQ